MKEIGTVLEQKRLDIKRLQEEVEILNAAVTLLGQDEGTTFGETTHNRRATDPKPTVVRV